ncbi:hypothetical protein T484DRAFT_1761083 [Baffinella frigidus]|nr:hypothetical protein T484DRAFT_1761083 [Cryptophyta sp. CCMP2293]
MAPEVETTGNTFASDMWSFGRTIEMLLQDDPVEREEAQKVDLQSKLKSAAVLGRRPFAREAAK